MAKTLTISAITLIALSIVQVSMAQQLITHDNCPSWVRKDAPSQCLGKIALASDLIDENPYSTEGKCYLIQTAPYEHDRQYLDRSTALFYLSRWASGRDSHPVWINYGEKPIPYDCTAWFIGIGVQQYKDVSGALQTIPKLKVVKIRVEDQLRRQSEKERWRDFRVDRRTVKEAPPECGQQVGGIFQLLADNPYETSGKCYFLFSSVLSDRQLLDRNRAIYVMRSPIGGGRMLIDFEKTDILNNWKAYVVGQGAFQYESAAGKLMTVPKVKIIKILK